MFSMADLPSVRDAKVRRSKVSASHSRPRSATETGVVSANLQVATMKTKTDRLRALLQQARIGEGQAEGGIRTIIREEVQRQLRSPYDSARTQTSDGMQSRTRTTNARRSSATLSGFSEHSPVTRRRQVRKRKL